MNRSVIRCFVTVLCAGSAAAQAEPLFAPPVSIAVNNIRGATPGDVDEDGFPDLVVWANGASVMHNLGGHGFAAAVGVPGSATAIHLADLDHDGHLDVVAVNGAQDAVRVALGAGNGSFGPYGDFATVDGVRDVVLADFDGDGNLDVAAPGLHATRVSVLLGLGDGSFAPKQDYGPVGDYATAITAADLSGDGAPDIAVASGDDSQVSLLYSVGDGSFTAATPVLLSRGADDVAATDLDDDGDLDLVVSMGSSSELRFAFNAGRGVFPHSDAVVPLISSVNSPLVVRDFDEDGRNDVAIGIGADDLVEVLHATGLPGSATLSLVGAYLGGENPQGLSCADLDLDGDLDLIGASFSANDVRILRGEGDGAFRTAASGWTLGVAPLGIATGDFDEDGHADLVTCGTGGALAVLINADNGHFPRVTPWKVPPTTRPDAVVGDFNGDGHADVATANAGFTGQSATVVLGAGNGLPLAVKNMALEGSWSWIAASDFDGDTDLDLVLGSAGAGPVAVRVAFNDGAGGMLPGPLLDSQWFGAAGGCTGDFNHDGKADIAISHDTSPGRITVFLGNGSGGFSAPVASESSGSQRDLVTQDFDGDGNLDLAISSYYSQFAVHAGHGDGTFGPATLYGFLPNPTGLAVGDLDHDGIADLVTADNHQFGNVGSLSVLIGHGDGSFEAPVAFRTGRQPWQVAIADFDGDGWNDLATAPLHATDVLLNQRGPWNELGHGLAGTQGIPRQVGTGTMLQGQPFAFTLRDARPLTTAYHVVGIAPLMLPFKGGTMVPTLNFINPFPVTDAQGNLALQGAWIGAPSGLSLYFQFWIPDPAAPLHFAASTAISATMP